MNEASSLARKATAAAISSAPRAIVLRDPGIAPGRRLMPLVRARAREPTPWSAS